MAKVLYDLGSTFSYIFESFAVEMEDRPAKLAFQLDVVTPLGEHNLAFAIYQPGVEWLGVRCQPYHHEHARV